MRIMLVIYSLGKGGAERVLSTMSNWWATHGCDVHVVVFTDSPVSAYPLKKTVRVTALGRTGKSVGFVSALRGNAERIASLRSVARLWQPDVVISFMDTTNVLTVLACAGVAPVIVTEHTPPTEGMVGMWRVLRRVTYPLARRVVVQTEEARDYYLGKLVRGIEVIPNPIDFDLFQRDSVRRKRLVGVGRLAEEKQFDQLIKAFSVLKDEFPEWSLEILGEGEERGTLEALCDKLGVADRVSLPGWVPDIGQRLAEASIFVLTSRFEGFCNALVEAMGAGVASVAYDCPTGPRTVVVDGVNGVLLPCGDGVALVASLRQLMIDPIARERLARKGREVRGRYATERVMLEWDNLLSELS